MTEEEKKEQPANSVSKAITDEEREAKIKRAQEARAARAAAAAKDGASPAAAGDKPARPAREAKQEDEAKPKEPSRNQPLLDRMVAIVNELVGEDAIEQSFINEKSDEMPTLVVKSERWLETAKALKMNPELSMHYLRNLAGVDQETHLELVYQMINLTTKKEVCVKVKTDREHPSIPSVTPVWPTADWNEREVFDLLGVDFPGHPDLRRIMMADDWEGHPLRKDYEPLDPEV